MSLPEQLSSPSPSTRGQAQLLLLTITFFTTTTTTTQTHTGKNAISPIMEANKRDEAIDALSSPSNPAHWYAYASSAFLISLSLPLLLFPRLLLLSTPRGAIGQPGYSNDQSAVSAISPQLTPLERYGSHTNAISMLAMAALILVLSGAIPVSTSPVPDSASSGKSPFRIPTVVVTALYFAANAFTAWTQSGPRQAKPAMDPANLGIGAFGKVVGFAHAAFAFWGHCLLSAFRSTCVADQYASEEKAKKSS